MLKAAGAVSSLKTQRDNLSVATIPENKNAPDDAGRNRVALNVTETGVSPIDPVEAWST